MGLALEEEADPQGVCPIDGGLSEAVPNLGLRHRPCGAVSLSSPLGGAAQQEVGKGS